MKFRLMFFVFLIICVTGIGVNNLLGVQGVVTFLSDVVEGNGTYLNPYVINSTNLKWRVDSTYGPNKENVLYRIDVHLDGYRSCATQVTYRDLSWSDLQDRIFEYTADMCGWYYIRIDINETGEYYQSTRLNIYCRVPPFNSYSLPYNPPAGNSKPVSFPTFVNKIQGTGIYTNPIIVSGPIIKFRIDDTYDPDGVGDLENGVFIWAIHTHGHHPVYVNGEGGFGYKAIDTFLLYPEIQGKIYEWDTRELLSSTGYYVLYVPTIDQHGEQAEIVPYHIKCNDDVSSDPVLNVNQDNLNFDDSNTLKTFIIENVGSGILNWSVSENPDQDWLVSITPGSGSLATNVSSSVNVTIDRSGLADNDYSGTILVTSNGGDQNVSVLLHIDEPPQPPQSVQIVNP